MITAVQVEEVAERTGFRADGVEKVLRLHDVLARLTGHPLTKGVWVLKGGTALNMFYLDVPRLSVDIDLNWVGSPDVEDMKRDRPAFERGLLACCEREGLIPRREPSEHAGGKYRLRYASVMGGTQNLEVDVNYVSRVPIWPSVDRRAQLPPGSTLEVPTLQLEELAAGKFTALVQRTAARDMYDAGRLLAVAPDLLSRPKFRIAFMCFVAGGRRDARTLRAQDRAVDPKAYARDVEPLLRVDAHEEKEAQVDVASRVQSAIVELLDWTSQEREFLDVLLDAGEIRPDLLIDDEAVLERIDAQSMLRWKALHVRRHKNI